MRTLEELYRNPATGLRSLKKFLPIAKKEGYSAGDVKDFFAKQDTAQIHKQIKPVYFPITGRGRGSWQIDLMDMRPEVRGYRWILCCINVNTRVAHTYAMKQKSETKTMLSKFLSEAKECNYIQSDQGTEFVNSDVKALMNRYNVEYYQAGVQDHKGQGMVERFNQTLRGMLVRYMDEHNTKDWVRVLGDITKNYNGMPNDGLKGLEPNDTDELVAFGLKMEQKKKAEKVLNKIQEGDVVRTLKNRGQFDKGRQRWSDDVHAVVEKEANHVVLENGLKMQPYQIQVITGSNMRPVEKSYKVAVEKQQKKKLSARRQKVAGVEAGAVVKGERKRREAKHKLDVDVTSKRKGLRRR